MKEYRYVSTLEVIYNSLRYRIMEVFPSVNLKSNQEPYSSAVSWKSSRGNRVPRNNLMHFNFSKIAAFIFNNLKVQFSKYRERG